jgi:Spy/CpxP family protein refolding chaperone
MDIAGKAKTQAWMLMLVVFLLGGVTGGAVDRFFFLKGQSSPPHARGERGGPGRLPEFLKRELNLTEEQTTAVKNVFEQMRKEFPPSRFNECPGMKESREKSRALIREILTPEQQKKYDEMNAKRDAEMQRRDAEAPKAEEKK